MPAFPRVVRLADEAATIRFAEDLAQIVRQGDCLALHGDLGTGKSTLARGLIRCIADDPDLDVPSPTFTLVQSYPLRVPLAHFDLYRISDPRELDELGLEEALAEGAVLVEWPDKAGSELPSDAIHIHLSEDGDGRQVSVNAPQEALDRIGRTMAIREFLDMSGFALAGRRFLLGDASARVYETIYPLDCDPILLMNAPRREIGPVIRDGKRYAQLARSAEDIRPFFAIRDFLDRSGFRVPDIHGRDPDQGLALIEHLGDDRIIDADAKPIVERWETAIDGLLALHELAIPESLSVPGEPDHVIPPFDKTAMSIEVDLFLDWYLPSRLGEEAGDNIRAEFEAAWDHLIDSVSQAEAGLVLRDYHSPNILWQAGETGIRRLGLIDFQDALLGPIAYDVASLVHDARVTIAPDLSSHLVVHYIRERTRREAGFDSDEFRRVLSIMQAQRATKILGIFVRLRDRDGKSGYMRHLPRIESYLASALEHPSLSDLRECYKRAGINLNES